MKPKFRFKNRKIKFREADYIEKHYIRDGKAIIPIHLNSIDELYMKHDLMTAGIEVSEHLYRVILEHSIELMNKKLMDPKPPVSLLGIPIVINNYLSDFNYRLVVSIPSWKFRK